VNWKNRYWVHTAIIIILSILIPLITNSEYLLYTLTLCWIWSIAALSLNLILGYTGQVSLTHGAFFGIGAYTTALLVKVGLNFWLSLGIALLLLSLTSFLIGLVAFRSRGSYFAIGTLSFNAIITLFIERLDSLTGGPRGVLGIPTPDPISIPYLLKITFQTLTAQYYLAFFFSLLTLVFIHLLITSHVGRAFISVKENESLAASLGINLLRMKILSFILSANFAGIAGSLYASFIGFLSPEVSSLHTTLEFLVYTIIGGKATLWGPVLGSFSMTAIAEVLHVLRGFRIFSFGIALLLAVIFIPEGLLSLPRKLKRRRKMTAFVRNKGNL
jgi:branched-chain amino acid transport system permease protein